MIFHHPLPRTRLKEGLLPAHNSLYAAYALFAVPPGGHPVRLTLHFVPGYAISALPRYVRFAGSGLRPVCVVRFRKRPGLITFGSKRKLACRAAYDDIKWRCVLQ